MADASKIADYKEAIEKMKEAAQLEINRTEPVKNIEDLLKLYQKKGGNFVKDIQILAPMYSGVCGIDKINEMIQEKFNPSTNMIVDNGRVFKENDKVLMLQNDPTLGIMNGDDGIIVSIEHLEKKDYIHINFGEKIVRIEGKDLDKITLGYAISIHKSQGSEYKNVILPIVPSFQIMLKPNLIYTAVTRAKGKLIILGNSQTLINSLYQKNDVRQTSLFQNEELKKKVLHVLEIQLADNEKAHIMQPDGSYEKIDRRGRKEVINAQEIFCEEAIRRNSEISKGRKTRTFRPRMGKE